MSISILLLFKFFNFFIQFLSSPVTSCTPFICLLLNELFFFQQIFLEFFMHLIFYFDFVIKALNLIFKFLLNIFINSFLSAHSSIGFFFVILFFDFGLISLYQQSFFILLNFLVLFLYIVLIFFEFDLTLLLKTLYLWIQFFFVNCQFSQFILVVQFFGGAFEKFCQLIFLDLFDQIY